MTAATPSSLLCPALVQREQGLVQLREVVEQRDAAAVAALIGGAGLGKSALAAAISDRTARVVLQGRATPDGSALRVLAEIAAAALVHGANVDAASLGSLRGGLAGVLPGIADATFDGAIFPLVTAEAILALVETIDRPSTLLLEDLHWADADTLEAIERVCDRVVTRPVTVVLVARPDCAADQLARRLAARRVATVIELRELDADGVAEMASLCLRSGAPEGLVNFLGAAGGSPYLVEELLRTAFDCGALTRSREVWVFDAATPVHLPDTLVDSITWRLDALPTEAARALAIFAALGDGLPPEAVARAAGLDGVDALNEVLRLGVRAQLLDATASQVRFRHALTRDAAAARLLPHERRDAAARALDAVTADDSRRSQVAASVLARVAELAEELDTAARWRLEAARRHSAASATTAALAEVDHALAVAQEPALRAAIWVERVELLALAGRDSDALAQAETAAMSPGLTTEDTVRVDLAIARCSPAGEQRATAIERALRHAEGGPLEARVEATAALLAVEDGDVDTASAHATLALDPRFEDPMARCQALEVLGRVARGRDLGDAQALFTQAATVAEVHGLALWRARALHERATIAQLRDSDVADLFAARAAAVDAGAPGLIASIDFHLAAVLATRFDGPEALEAARRFLDLSAALDRGNHAWGWVLIGLANVVSARWTHAESALAEAERVAGPDVEVATIARFCGAGLTRLLHADLEAAAAGYEKAMDALVANSPMLSPLPPWYLGPLLLTIVGDGNRARAQADRTELHVTSICRAPWLMAEAVAAGRAGDTTRAQGLVAEADELWTGKAGLDAHRHLSRWLAARPAAQNGWGEPTQWLFDAETWATDKGVDRITDTCRAQLRALGATPRRRRGTTVVPADLRRHGVTSREVDVLALVAEGLTNPEIADRLHLSRGTVKGYVSQLLAKTGATNRAGLARVAAQNGLGSDNA